MGLHERIRLLYVACTRARDHLIMSVATPRFAVTNPPKASARTNAELLLEGMGDLVGDLPDAAVDGDALRPVVVEPPTAAGPVRGVGSRTVGGAPRLPGAPTTVAASALTDEGEPDSEGNPTRACRNGRRTSTFLPGSKAATERRSGGPCTGSCRRSTFRAGRP